MKFANLCTFVIIYICLASVAQSQKVFQPLPFSVLVDGQPTCETFKVEFVVNNRSYPAPNNKGVITVPKAAEDISRFGIRIVSRHHSIFFHPVFEKDLEAEWTLRID